MDETVESKEFLITTIDNPYNPFTQSDEWYKYDITYGYNTYATVDRMIEDEVDSSTPDDERQEAYNRAMLKLIELNPLYIKVTSDSEVETEIKNIQEAILGSIKEDNSLTE